MEEGGCPLLGRSGGSCSLLSNYTSTGDGGRLFEDALEAVMWIRVFCGAT